MPRTFTLAALRTKVRSRADMPVGSFVSDADLNDWLNSAICELDEILMRSGLGYKEATLTITTDAVGAHALGTYVVPADFLGVLALDYQVDTSRYASVPQLSLRQRNAYGGIGAGRAMGYTIVGGNIQFYPVPTPGQTYRLTYVPSSTLASDSDTYDGVNGWEELVVLIAAKRALQKEESIEAAQIVEREIAYQRGRIEQAAELRTVEATCVGDGDEDERDASDWWPRRGWR